MPVPLYNNVHVFSCEFYKKGTRCLIVQSHGLVFESSQFQCIALILLCVQNNTGKQD